MTIEPSCLGCKSDEAENTDPCGTCFNYNNYEPLQWRVGAEKLRPLGVMDTVDAMCWWSEEAIKKFAGHDAGIEVLMEENTDIQEQLIFLYQSVLGLKIYGNIGWIFSGLLLIALMLQ